MLTGKGMWFWQIEKTEADPSRLVELAKQANLKHVIIKVADGTFDFPIPSRDPGGHLESLTQNTIKAFQAAGIEVWGWSFIYGSGVDIKQQARRLAARVLRFDLSGVVVNAEDFGTRLWSSAGGADRAKQFMENLQDSLSGVSGGVLTAFSSYRYMSYHPTFPFAAFMAYCDIAMPQVYWVANGAGDALRNLQDSYNEYRAAFPRKLYVPTGAAYGEYYGSGSSRFFWSATPDQMTIFMNQAKSMGLPAVNFWSWQHARNDRENIWFSNTRLWDTIANYRYDTTTPDDPSQPSPGEEVVKEIQVGGPGHFDGMYQGIPNNAYTAFVRNGISMKYAQTATSRSGVWAAWFPGIQETGKYDIQVWVPGVNTTTQKARYFIQGVVGQPSAIQVELNQQRFYDSWVSLGVYDLDGRHPQSGLVNLTNLTGEAGRLISFAGVRWLKVTAQPTPTPTPTPTPGLADGFDAPVGTADERRGGEIWPGEWFDATGFATRYTDSAGSSAYHTGADLNLNRPSWNLDAGMPVYAIASGEVTFAGRLNIWGSIVIIRHDPLRAGGAQVYSRSAHLATVSVRAGQRVARGTVIGTIGRPETGPQGIEHLHFDISLTEALFSNPGDWPRLDYARLQRDYVDPRAFIQANRP